MLTGESVPVEVGPATRSPVPRSMSVAGWSCGPSGRRRHPARQMARLVEDAQNGKAEVQRLADRVSGVFVPVVSGGRHPRFLGWLRRRAGAGLHRRGRRPDHRLPLRTRAGHPTALMVGTGRGAQLGILIRGPEVLESTRRSTPSSWTRPAPSRPGG